jgi:uncharacterized membrane protein YkoI
MKGITNIAIAALALGIAGSSASAQYGTTKTETKTPVQKTKAAVEKPKTTMTPKKTITPKKTEIEADLMKEAKISKDSATSIALAKVPGATVQSAEIEREHGRLIWSFDLKTAGKAGIDEVNVNALTGKVVGKTQHETPKTEKKEAVQEAKEKPKTTKK